MLFRSRAITGYSMGGHGALWLAFRHPGVFGACGSMSGGVDIRPFPNNWKISEQLGPYSENPRLWDEHTVIEQLYRVVPFTDRNREVASKEARPVDYSLQPGQLAIVIDCGTEDYFFEVNRQLHERMLYRHISRVYRPARRAYARLLARGRRVSHALFPPVLRLAGADRKSVV